MKELCLTLTSEKLKAECYQEAMRAENIQVFMLLTFLIVCALILAWVLSDDN